MSDEPVFDLPSSVSVDQLLDIWGELVSAHGGQNRYGGHVAQIYAYRLQRFDPRVVDDYWRKELKYEHAQAAKRSLLAIVRRFESEWDCRCMFDGVWADEWERTAVYDHRVHVEVVPGGES